MPFIVAPGSSWRFVSQGINGTAHTVGGGIGNLFRKEQGRPDRERPQRDVRRQGSMGSISVLHERDDCHQKWKVCLNLNWLLLTTCMTASK